MIEPIKTHSLLLPKSQVNQSREFDTSVLDIFSGPALTQSFTSVSPTGSGGYSGAPIPEPSTAAALGFASLRRQKRG